MSPSKPRSDSGDEDFGAYSERRSRRFATPSDTRVWKDQLAKALTYTDNKFLSEFVQPILDVISSYKQKDKGQYTISEIHMKPLCDAYFDLHRSITASKKKALPTLELPSNMQDKKNTTRRVQGKTRRTLDKTERTLDNTQSKRHEEKKVEQLIRVLCDLVPVIVELHR
ncbi:hypothetical protein LTR22_027979, partial [Elasticomyces elasticus]